MAGLGYGTVAYGSEMYSLNVNTDELSTLYQEKDNKHQILDFKVVGKELILQLINYDDDNYNTFIKVWER